MPEPDDIKAEEEAKAEAAKLDTVKAIADQFTEALAAEREARVAPAPVVAAPAGPSAQEKAAELIAKQTKVQEEADELAASGEFSKAAQHLLSFQSEINAATQGDPTEAPAYKALIVTAERESKRDNAPMFEKYGDDIKAEIASMSPGDRINPEAWDEAVRRVKAQHVDEIIQDRIDAASEEGKKKQEEEAAKGGRFFAPAAPGSQGKKNATEVVELDEQQIAAAALLGYTPEKYAEIIVAAEATTIRKGWSAGMHELCDTDKPEPGRF